MFVNTLTGLLLPDPQEEELFHPACGTGQDVPYVLLPTAAPLIFAGLRIGLTLALAGAIVAEFVSAQVGLGLLVQRFSDQLDLDHAFAVVFVLTAMGLALYGLIALAGHSVVFWRREGSQSAERRPDASISETHPERGRGCRIGPGTAGPTFVLGWNHGQPNPTGGETMTATKARRAGAAIGTFALVATALTACSDESGGTATETGAVRVASPAPDSLFTYNEMVARELGVLRGRGPRGRAGCAVRCHFSGRRAGPER